MRGARRNPETAIDYGRFTQYQLERNQLRRRRHRDPLSEGAHPPAPRHVRRRGGRRFAARRGALRADQGGRGQLDRRIYHGCGPADRHHAGRQRGHGARLRPRHPPQVTRGGRRADEHGRQVRGRCLQEDRGSERCGRQGREHAFRRVYGPLGARRRSPYGDLRQGTRSERQVGERGQREERHVHLVPRRQGDFRPVRLQPRIRRAENPQLQLPESGPDAQFQRQELRFEKRPAGPRERQHDRGPALPADPPHGGRTSRW